MMCAKLRVVFGGLVTLGALGCSSPSGPEALQPMGGSGLEELTTPGAVFHNLVLAFQNKDIGAYRELLDPDFVYISPSTRSGPDAQWRLSFDEQGIRRAFETFDSIELTFRGTGQRYTERGDEFPDHPDEDWEVFQRPVHISLLDNDGVDGFNVLQDMIFRLRQDPETRLWRVREWEDVITN